MGLETGIWASWLGFEPHGWDLSHEARIFGLEARILSLNLGFGPQGWDLGLKARI